MMESRLHREEGCKSTSDLESALIRLEEEQQRCVGVGKHLAESCWGGINVS